MYYNLVPVLSIVLSDDGNLGEAIEKAAAQDTLLKKYASGRRFKAFNSPSVGFQALIGYESRRFHLNAFFDVSLWGLWTSNARNFTFLPTGTYSFGLVVAIDLLKEVELPKIKKR